MQSDRLFKIVIMVVLGFAFYGLIAGEFMDRVPIYDDVFDFVSDLFG